MKKDHIYFLKREFERRTLRNANYSMRAFARDLGLPVSKVSEMLRGKQGISRDYAQNIAKKLKLGGSDLRIFLASVDLALSRTPAKRKAAQLDLNAAQFDAQVIDIGLALTPLHYAIKCFLEVETYRGAQQVMLLASRLKLEPSSIENLLKDLSDHGHIRQLDDGTWGLSEGKNTRVLTLDKSQKEQKLEHLKYRHVFDDVVAVAMSSEGELAERLLSRVIFAVPRTEVSRLKEMLNHAKSSLLQFCEGHPDCNDVYCLSMSLVPYPKASPRA